MLTATVRLLSDDSIVQEQRFDHEAEARGWLKYQVPSANLEKLKRNTKITVDDYYVLSLKGPEAELKSADDDDEEAVEPAPAKPTTVKK